MNETSGKAVPNQNYINLSELRASCLTLRNVIHKEKGRERFGVTLTANFYIVFRRGVRWTTLWNSFIPIKFADIL